MSSNLPYKQAANVERRTWDKEAFEARARARAEADTNGSKSTSDTLTGQKRPLSTDQNSEEKEEFTPALPGAAGPERSQRAFLQSRRSKVDLESKVGTTEIINPDAVATSSSIETSGTVSITDGVTKSATGVGWHCRVCDCFLKDSMTYLDHINGRKHQRYLGFSMRVEKSTKQEVSSKLAELAKAKQKPVSSIESILSSKDEGINKFETLVREKDEELLRRKAERARKREERKKKILQEQEEEETEGVDPDMAAMMGFSGFS